MDGHSVHVAGSFPLSRDAQTQRIVRPRRGQRASSWTQARSIDLPPAPAVYVLISQDRIVYVGSTNNLARRVQQHRTQHGREIEVRFSLSFRRGDWLRREHRLIAKLRPPWNSRVPQHRR